MGQRSSDCINENNPASPNHALEQEVPITIDRAAGRYNSISRITMPFAARMTDMHVCPMMTGLVPHVGGPIMSPGVPTVLIGGLPAAALGNMCTCVGPLDVIVQGSAAVMIGGRPAARMGDQCAHGGVIVLGCPTVSVGG